MRIFLFCVLVIFTCNGMYVVIIVCRNTQLSKEVPTIKKCLEKFIIRMKIMMDRNDRNEIVSVSYNRFMIYHCSGCQ